MAILKIHQSGLEFAPLVYQTYPTSTIAILGPGININEAAIIPMGGSASAFLTYNSGTFKYTANFSGIARVTAAFRLNITQQTTADGYGIGINAIINDVTVSNNIGGSAWYQLVDISAVNGWFGLIIKDFEYDFSLNDVLYFEAFYKVQNAPLSPVPTVNCIKGDLQTVISASATYPTTDYSRALEVRTFATV